MNEDTEAVAEHEENPGDDSGDAPIPMIRLEPRTFDLSRFGTHTEQTRTMSTFDGRPQHAMAPEAPAQYTPQPGERAFRVMLASEGEPGQVVLRHSSWLPARVFGRAVAVRYAMFEAKRSLTGPLQVLMDASGRVIGVYLPGSGKLAPPPVVKAVKQAAAGPIKRTKRTSRSVTSERPAKRTSKVPARRR